MKEQAQPTVRGAAPGNRQGGVSAGAVCECGFQNAPGNAFCERCGKRLTTAREKGGKESLSVPSRKTSPAQLAGCLLALGVLGAAILLWPKLGTIGWQWKTIIGVVTGFVILRLMLLGAPRAVERGQVTAVDLLFKAGRYDEALQRVEEVLIAHPTNSEAWYLKGQCLDRLGRTKEADAAWEEALKHNASNAAAAHNLGCNYLNRGDYFTAAKYFIMARVSGAEFVEASVFQQNVRKLREALARVGIETERKGDYVKALEYGNVIVGVDPEFAIGFAWRAKQHVNLGHYREAMDDAKTCLRLDPSYTKVNLVLKAAEEGLNREAALRSLGQPTALAHLDGRSSSRLSAAGAPGGLETLPCPMPKSEPVEDQAIEARSTGITLWQVGEKAFGRILIRKIIGEGGMGIIYCGWDEQSNTPLALKAIRFEGDESDELQRKAFEHFQQEAEQWFRLGQHPRIVTLFSVEKLDYRHLVLVMEFISGDPDIGPTLHHHLRAKKQLPVEAAVRIAIEIAEAMQYAHQKGQLIHRDLKPQNVFVTVSGWIKVGDFGLAVPSGSKMGGFAGTAEYAAPEQWDAEAVATAATDVYAIGIMLFEMICGRRPFDLGEEYQYAMTGARIALYGDKHRTETPPDPASFCAAIPPRLRSLILKCLAKDPRARPASFPELKAMLVPFAGAGWRATDSDSAVALEDSGAAAYDLGVSASALGHLEEAVNCYREAVQHEPFKSQRSEAWANLAKVLGELHRFDESIGAGRRAVQINPNDFNALQCLSTSLAANGELKGAQQLIERLLTANPSHADACVCNGWIWLQMGDVDGATAAYAKAASLKPDHHYAWNGLGLCAEARQDYKSARTFFEKAIAIHERFGEAHNNCNRILQLLGNMDVALESARRAVECEPANALYQANLGITLGKLRRFADAVLPLQSATRLEPKNATAWLALAQVLGELRDCAQAIQCGRRAADLGEPGGMEVVRQAEKQIGRHQ